jgi:hypothetical protein
VILTDLVVRANNWAQALVGQRGVHVADSAATVMSLVEKITADPGRVDRLFAPSNSRVGMIPKETRQQVKDSLHREVGGFFMNTSRARHLSCMPSTICRPGEQSPQRC